MTEFPNKVSQKSVINRLLQKLRNDGTVDRRSSTGRRRTDENVEAVDTIRYDSVYLTCSKKLTGSQLSLPHGINKTLKCKTKNKMMSVIGPVQSRYREAVQ